jgi:hypothetical protein
MAGTVLNRFSGDFKEYELKLLAAFARLLPRADYP